MVGMLPVDSPLVLLPSSTFCSHIYTGLTGEDRKALRLACKGSRLFVNGEVTVARIFGSTLRAGGPTFTLQRVVETCPQLNGLVLNDTHKDHVCGQLLAEFLADDAAHDEGSSSPGAGIQTLDVKQCNFLKAADLQRLFATCSRLQSLHASRWADASHLRALLLLTDRLTALDLGDAAYNVLTINDKSLAHLPRLPALRSLSLKRCVEVTDDGVAHLAAPRLPNLTSLDLSSTRVTGASGFQTLANLRSLVLQGCRAFADAGLAAVCARHAGELRTLYLHGTAVQPGGGSLWHLAQATGLEMLDLGTASEVDIQGLAALSCCRSLADLRLGNFNLRPPSPPRHPHHHHHQPDNDGDDLAAADGAAALWALPEAALASATAAAATVGSLPSLTRLSLGGMFCQHGLDRLLRGLPRLRRLELAGLDTARDQVLGQLVGSGAGAATSLQELHLARGGPDLTAEGLMRLAELPALRRLTLLDCPAAAADATLQQLVQSVRRAGRQLQLQVISKPGAAADGRLMAAAGVVAAEPTAAAAPVAVR